MKRLLKSNDSKELIDQLIVLEGLMGMSQSMNDSKVHLISKMFLQLNFSEHSTVLSVHFVAVEVVWDLEGADVALLAGLLRRHTHVRYLKLDGEPPRFSVRLLVPEPRGGENVSVVFAQRVDKRVATP